MAIVEPQIKQYTMPEDTRGVFTSTMFSRKKRISLLVEWFMQNYWRYPTPNGMLTDDIPIGEAFVVRPMTGLEFANALTESMQSIGVIINRQRVWTWTSERNLPREETFRFMIAIAGGWQKEFALLMLSVLGSAEPIASSTTSELHNV